jgi:hypothetical protein
MVAKILRFLKRYWNGLRTRSSLSLLLFARRVRSRPGLAAPTAAAVTVQRAARREPAVDPGFLQVPRVRKHTVNPP